MLDFLFPLPEPKPKPVPTPAPEPVSRAAVPDHLLVDSRSIPLHIVRNDRARRYLLRLNPDGAARLTIPRRGTIAEGRKFAERQTDWLAGQLTKLAARPVKRTDWRLGTEILFRGEPVALTRQGDTHAIQFADQLVRVPDVTTDLRPAITRHLLRLANAELPPRTIELARAHNCTVARVTIRNQRSRWGSCSRRGTISLNWRLIQTPAHVRDYILLHELMHLRQLNHSVRFWREVESVCPDYRTAESWLRQHSDLLR